MTPESIAALASIPSAIAVIVTVREFLKYMGEQRSIDRAQFAAADERRSAERSADRLLWENHLSGTVKVLDGLLSEMRELRRDIVVVRELKREG